MEAPFPVQWKAAESAHIPSSPEND